MSGGLQAFRDGSRQPYSDPTRQTQRTTATKDYHMISVNKLKAITTIVSHERCPDGIASALILKDMLPDARVIFCQYGTPEHESLPAEPGMIFADFSPHPNRVKDFVDAGAIVLDHHRTAKDVVGAFGDSGVFADEKSEPGVSGAVLAFREVWLPLWDDQSMQIFGRVFEIQDDKPNFPSFVRQFAKIAGVRDTWQKSSPLWEESCVQGSALFFVPQEELLAIGLKQISNDWEIRYKWAGQLRNLKHLKTVQRAVQEGMRHTTAEGVRILMFQGTKLSSDAAGVPGVEADIICGFDVIWEKGQKQIKYLYSVRSRSNFDCSALAKFHGGGGHKGAAGFNIITPTSDPYNQFIMAVREFANKS